MLGNSWHVPTAMWILFLLLLQPSFGIQQPIQHIRKGSLGMWLICGCATPTHGDRRRATTVLYTCHRTTGKTTSDGPGITHLQSRPPPLPSGPSKCRGPYPTCRTYSPTSCKTSPTCVRPCRKRATLVRNTPRPLQKSISTTNAHTGPTSDATPVHGDYPQTQSLHEEMSNGFDLLGQLRPGVDWHIRQGHKYLAPCNLTELRSFNHDYIQRKLKQHKVNDRWTLMATEIAIAPTNWPLKTIPLLTFKHTDTVLPLPHAFSVQQTRSDGKAKICRGEDWRRSGHNQTCSTHDQPYHHTPDHYIQCAWQYTTPKQQLHVWGARSGSSPLHSRRLHMFSSSPRTDPHSGITTCYSLGPPPASGSHRSGKGTYSHTCPSLRR